MITHHDMTVYNKYHLSGAEKYQRTQVPNIKWENRKAANVLKSGLLGADSVSVYVPFQRGMLYKKPKVWQALVTKTGYWSLQDGDYLVKGLVTDEIGTGFTISALKAKYDDCVMIKSVDTFDSGSSNIQHWQIGAS